MSTVPEEPVLDQAAHRRSRAVWLLLAIILLLTAAAAGLYVTLPSLLAPAGELAPYQPPDPAQVATLAGELLRKVLSLEKGAVTTITLGQQETEQITGVLLFLMGEAGAAVPQAGVPGSIIPIARWQLAEGSIRLQAVAVTPLQRGLMARFGGMPVAISASLRPSLRGNSLRVEVADLQVGRWRMPTRPVLRYLSRIYSHRSVFIDAEAGAVVLRLPPSYPDPQTGREFMLESLSVDQGILTGTIRRIR